MRFLKEVAYLIALTIFKNIFDNKTNKRMDFSDFNKFEDLLYSLSTVKRNKKKDSYLISPAIYKESSSRRNDNVIEWAGWTAIDIDTHDFKGNLEEELFKKYGDWRYICHSTASSTIENPKFRLIFELKNSIESTKIKQFWFSLNTEFNEIGDKQCKDLSRMYYIPAIYLNANNFIFSNRSGSQIDPDLIISKHPFILEKKSAHFIDRLPNEVKDRVIQYRKESLGDRKNITWNSYQDCPFINQKLIDEYKSISNIDGSGRYSMIYKIMTSIASIAIKNKYPISENEIVSLIKQLDKDTSNRYEKRPLNVEASRAIEYAYRKM